MIIDGAVESITESILCFALDTNSTSALVESSVPWNTFVVSFSYLL
jgi:hypothetical protein